MPYHLLGSLLFLVLGLGLFCIRNDRWWVAATAGAICGVLGPLITYMTERV